VLPSSWTDEEYALVATALLYPAARYATIVVGHSPAAQFAWQLGGKLEQIPTSLKPQVLVLAQQVHAAEEALTGRALGGGGGCMGNLNVVQVGDIRLDLSQGRGEVEGQAGRLRRRLSDLVAFPINPQSALGSGGGINGTWST
jgi:hypothetical protein